LFEEERGMTSVKSMPSGEQLKEYAAKMPPVYRDLLVAIREIDPYRCQGEGVFESSLRNKYFNKVNHLDGTTTSTTTTPPTSGIEDRNARVVDDEFALLIDKLVDRGFLEDPIDTPFARIVPTKLGEALIEELTGRPTPRIEVPELPPINW
jgi:hypothetical protein